MAFDGFEILDDPNAERAEIAILGEILLNNALIRQTAKLGVFNFSTPFRRAVFSAMLELDEEGKPIDPILIGEILKREKQDYALSSITNLTFGLPEMPNLRQYVSIILDASARIKAVRDVESLAKLLSAKRITVKEFCTRVSVLESELRNEFADETDSFKPLGEILEKEVLPTLGAYFRKEVSEFLISTGFDEIDEILGGGLYLSDFLAIVAPPKSAKSAFALQLALNFAEAGETVGLLSLEMSNLQNGLRFITQKSYKDSVRNTGTLQDAINAGSMRPGMYESTYRHASAVAASLFDTKLFVCQKPLSWTEVQAETRRLVKEKGLRVLIVDYWQLVFNSRRGQTRADSLAEIAKGLKQLGQELNICIVALGQFNQEGLKHHKTTGELSTLYLEGSGELAKSANIVLTLDIEPADIKQKPVPPRRGKLIFRPLRSGADAELGCEFYGKYLTVEIDG